MFKKLFKKKEETKEESKRNGGTFLGFVLVDEVVIDFKKLQEDLLSDWNIDMNDSALKNSDSDDYARVFDVDDYMVAISLMPAPIPNQEAEFQAQANHNWAEAVDVAKAHKGHIMVSVLRGQNNPKTAGELFVKVCASTLKQNNATAMNVLGSLYSPEQYIEMAEYSIKTAESTPIYNLVYFGMYRANEETISAYTYGLEVFNKKEIEIIESKESMEDIQNFMENIVLYIIDYDATLLDGETIGFTEDQKLSLTESRAVALNPETTTIKIGY